MSEVSLRFPQRVIGIVPDQQLAGAIFQELDAEPSGPVLDPLGELELQAEERHRAALDLTQHIALTVKQVESLVSSRLEELGRYAVELGLGLAEQLVEHEIEVGRTDPTPHVVHCLERAVQGVAEGSVVVRLHPADLSHVLSELDRIEAPEVRSSAVRFEVDPALGRGACRVETSVGRIEHDPREVVRDALARVREEAGLDAP